MLARIVTKIEPPQHAHSSWQRPAHKRGPPENATINAAMIGVMAFPNRENGGDALRKARCQTHPVGERARRGRKRRPSPIPSASAKGTRPPSRQPTRPYRRSATISAQMPTSRVDPCDHRANHPRSERRHKGRQKPRTQYLVALR